MNVEAEMISASLCWRNMRKTPRALQTDRQQATHMHVSEQTVGTI